MIIIQHQLTIERLKFQKKYNFFPLKIFQVSNEIDTEVLKNLYRVINRFQKRLNELPSSNKHFMKR